jgi:uncharacterized membrane protein
MLDTFSLILLAVMAILIPIGGYKAGRAVFVASGAVAREEMEKGLALNEMRAATMALIIAIAVGLLIMAMGLIAGVACAAGALHLAGWAP